MTRPVPSRRQAIADDLRKRILTGRLKADERLPSEARLASHYRVSTPTLRHALASLESEGLIEKIHGKGNYVRHPRRRITYVGGSLAPSLNAPDGAALRVSFRTTTLQAHGHLVGLLEVPEYSPLTELLCLNYAGDSPHSLARIYIPAGLAPAAMSDVPPCRASLGVWLGARRPLPTQFRERVTARPPTPDEATTLRISPALTVLVVTRVGTDRSGRIVEATLLVLPTDRTEALFTTHPAPGEKEQDQ